MKLKKIQLIALLLMTCSMVFAQSARVKRAEQMMKNLAYTDAIKELNQVLAHNDDAQAKIDIAECYRKISDPENAEYWYGQVVRLQEAQPVHYLYYGQSLQRNGKCDLAKEWYTKFTVAVPDDVRGQYLDKACDYEQELKVKNAGIYEVKHCDFNSNMDDFSPAFYDKGLVFTSERDKGVAVKRDHAWTGMAFNELYFVDAKNQGDQPVFGRPEKFSSDLNSKYHDAVISFTKDQQTAFFTRNNYKDGKTGKDDEGIVRLKVYSATKKGSNDWGSVESLPFNSDEYSVAHPSVSADGNKLYFASDMPGGFGGMDIYVSELENGRWGPPMNLGPKINTEGHEIFPYTRLDRLYYSSDGHVGLGGLDIYFVDSKGNGEWSDPENLGFPMNTDDDDFGIIFDEEGTAGYLSSDREGGSGRDDIYSFKKLAVPVTIYVYDADTKQPIEGAEVIENCNNRKLTTGANGKVTYDVKINSCCTFGATKEEYTPNSKEGCTKDLGTESVFVEIPMQKAYKFNMEGIVFDLSSGLPLEGAQVVLTNDCGDEERTATSDKEGRFVFEKLKKECCYNIKGSKSGYFAASLDSMLCTKGLTESTVLRASLNLAPTTVSNLDPNNPSGSTSGTGSSKVPKRDSSGKYIDQESGMPADGTYGGVTYKNGDIIKKPGTATSTGMDPSGTVYEGGSQGYLLHIYYDFDQSFLRDESTPELEKLLKIMQDNPQYIIEIASHTDSRGNGTYNSRLSQRRAESVVRWLVQKGIQRDNLVPRGYGETKNVNNCANNIPCNEKEHQMNRRTEFRVLGCRGCAKEEYISAPNDNTKVDPCQGCPF